MNLNQEIPCLTWWSDVSSVQRETCTEALELLSRILTARQTMECGTQVLKSIYLPIIKAGGLIPESMEFAQLCEKLRVNRHNIDEEIRELCIQTNTDIGTYAAAEILWLPPREVRRLIANKALPAIKVGRHWSIATIDVLRLADKNLKA